VRGEYKESSMWGVTRQKETRNKEIKKKRESQSKQLRKEGTPTDEENKRET